MPSKGINIHTDMRQYESLKARLSFFKNGPGNKAVRQSLRASLPPVRKTLKASLMALRRFSKQSTGATIRAITTKVRYPRVKGKGRGYALVGIDWDHYEHHFRSTASDRKSMGLRRRGTKLYGISTNSKGKSIIVRSYQRSQARVSRKRGHKTQRNRPAKYWHLINNGFTHFKSKRKVRGQQYANKAATISGPEGVNRMVEVLEGYLSRAGFVKSS